jgi:hypothetical protein
LDFTKRIYLIFLEYKGFGKVLGFLGKLVEFSDFFGVAGKSCHPGKIGILEDFWAFLWNFRFLRIIGTF